MESIDKKIKAKRSALGRGLSALISNPVSIVPPKLPVQPEKSQVSEAPTASIPVAPAGNLAIAPVVVSDVEVSDSEGEVGEVSYLSPADMEPNPKQPRQHFDEAELTELANSIATLGVLQPVLVRKTAVAGRYEIIAGERRWRASQKANLQQIPVVVRDLDDRETLEVALVENLQRSNLNPIEEARAYQRLADEFSLTQQEVSERVGKDRVSVANSMRLLKLTPEVLALCESRQLSMGHARTLLSIKDGAAQSRLAKKAISEDLSVRELESLVARAVVLDAGKVAAAGQAQEKVANQQDWAQFSEIVDRLRNSLGTKVNIRHHQSGKGRIEIEYFSEEELDRLVDKICV